MRLFLLAGVAAVVLSATATAQDAPKVNVEWKFAKGETLRYEVDTTYEVTGAGAAKKHSVIEIALVPAEVAADGSAALKVTFERATSERKADAARYKELVGKSFTMKMSRTGRISDVKGLAELMKKLRPDGDEDGDDDDGDEDGDDDDDDDGANSMQQCFPLLPAAALTKGTTVEHDAVSCTNGAEGAPRLKSTLKELRDSGSSAVVEQGWTVGPKKEEAQAPMGLAAASCSSEILWRVDRGALQSYKAVTSMAGSAAGKEFSVKMCVTVKQVPGKK
jgi:hypothetical protein